MVIDIAIAVLLILALVLGYQRGVIQPLLAEIFFFGTLLVIFRFHDTYTNEMEKIAHLNAVFSVAVAIVAAVILGAVGGAIGGAFHRMDAIAGIHQLEQLYTGFIEPQLHSSRAVPIILGIGDKLPVIGHVGPGDLKPVPTPSACASPSPSPSPAKSPAKASPSPKVTPTPNPCASPSPSPSK